jgi:aryl-alcohol dehydrogenase-like predicted oxidoreductase
MEIRTLGRTGLRVSLVGLGCNNFGGRLDLAGTRRVVDAALDAGITFLDTSDSYGNRGGSEQLLGEVLAGRRPRVVLATKFASPMEDGKHYKDASRGYIVRAVEASLARLRTDWIDLYQMHYPDAATPMEETLRALDDLVTSGKVRYIGASNLDAWQVADAAWIARHHGLAPFASVQNEYSVLVRGHSAPLLPALAHYGVGLLPYYPLASGLLTGKYVRGQPLPAGRLQSVKSWHERFLTERNWTIVEALRTFCEARKRTLAELAFGWLATQPAVASIIAGASTAEQVAANAAACGWRLSPEEMAEVDRIVLER